MTAERHALDDGRWHLRHGPIDIVVGADGERDAVASAHEAAWRRFCTVLDELVAELPLLRAPVAGPCPLRGVVARRMWEACRAVRTGFITPMAAVAGAVADELVGAYRRDGVARAWVNNGGDIALHLTPGRSLRVGLFADLSRFDAPLCADLAHGRTLPVDGWFDVAQPQPVRGVATSGWRGRSFSLGIADSVTVLARTAAEADAASTVIANAVDVDDGRIVRRAANTLRDDTDLGARPVTVEVPPLDSGTVHRALCAGLECARALRQRGLIRGAALVCQGQAATTIDAAASPALAASRDPASIGAMPARPALA